MTLEHIVTALQPLANSKVVATIAPVLVSSTLGAIVALIAYRFRSQEPLAASITWQWDYDINGQQLEEPYLTIQNRSTMPAYLKRARILKGLFLRFEARRYAFSYDDHDSGNFPLEVKAASVTSFPLSSHRADHILSTAWLVTRLLAYLFRRSYVWLEVTTIGGRRVMVPANDMANFRGRPLWVDLRWLPEDQSEWKRVLAKPDQPKSSF